jgi:hypothetical protein
VLDSRAQFAKRLLSGKQQFADSDSHFVSQLKLFWGVTYTRKLEVGRCWGCVRTIRAPREVFT